MTFLKKLYPDDFEAIQWLNRNVIAQPVILEANGDSYTDYGRISMATGLPTIQGWFVHEWLWRGDDKKVSQRYHVGYVIIGKLERNKFINLKEEKIVNLGKVVFNSPNTKVIQVNLITEASSKLGNAFEEI